MASNAVKSATIFSYGSKRIPCNIWTSPNTKSVTTIIFLGVLQIGKLPEWVARACPPNVAVVQGAPYWHFKPNDDDLVGFMCRFVESAYDFIGQKNASKKLNIIAESQAAPAVINLAINRPQCNNIVLVQPFGITHKFLHTTKAIMTRFIKSGIQHIPQLIKDERLLYNDLLVGRLVMHVLSGRIVHIQKIGTAYNGLIDLKKLTINRQHDQSNVTILVGDKDILFPYHEIAYQLKSADIDIPIKIVANMPHSTFASKHGQKLLLAALDAAKHN